jgi:DNA-binding transcriptional MerR regulator
MGRNSKQKLTKAPLILRGDAVLAHFQDFISDKGFQDIRAKLTEKKKTVSETDESYRTINSWSEAGLLLEEERENGWRKFSLLDLCWLRVIRELRKIGFSLEQLSNLKSHLFNGVFATKKDDTSIFEFFMAKAFSESVYLIVTSEGAGDFCLPQEYELSQAMPHFPTSHIVININQILSETTGNPKYANKKIPLILLNDKEIELLSKVTEGEISEAKVKVRDNKINRISYETLIDNPESTIEIIKDLFREGGNREITIYQQGKRGYQIKRVDKT